MPNLIQDTELFIVMMSKIWYIGAPQGLFPWGAERMFRKK